MNPAVVAPDFDAGPSHANLTEVAMQMFRTRLPLILVLALTSAGATAHEVWIEPESWEISAELPLRAKLVNGENFEGIELIWNDATMIRAERWDATGVQQIVGRLGDRPALATTADQDGLLTLLYQSSVNTVDYTKFDEFAAFVVEKGHDDVLLQHAERRLLETPIREAYSRFAKALVAVGPGQGADAPRGLEIEIVALTNPYTADPNEEMQFQVLYQGAPLVGNRVTFFDQTSDGTVEVSLQVTDDAGTVSINTVSGHAYLVDTVILREPDRSVVLQTRGAVWESLWASMTFRVPQSQ